MNSTNAQAQKLKINLGIQAGAEPAVATLARALIHPVTNVPVAYVDQTGLIVNGQGYSYAFPDEDGNVEYPGTVTAASMFASTYEGDGNMQLEGTVDALAFISGTSGYLILKDASDNETTLRPTTGAAAHQNLLPSLAGTIALVNPVASEKSADYTFALGDAENPVTHAVADNNARTFTIPANGTVAFPVGSEIQVNNLINTVTISITTDTLKLSPAGTTGNRTLAVNGCCLLRKVATTTWLAINQGGLT